MTAVRAALLLGTVSFVLIVGALGFQYLGGIAPCEMCHWQRWPHIAAAIIGLGGGALIANGTLDARSAWLVVWIALALIAIAGALGAYHAGVEWKLWAGPAACTGERVVFTGLHGINENGVVRCDQPAWRLFGLSLAGYNAIISLGVAAGAAYYLTRSSRR